MTPVVFGMVSLRASLKYTEIALKTFFETTTLREGDRFVLIDNDGSLGDVGAQYSQVEVYRPSRQQSFAQNANYAMELAHKTRSDLIFLNNDLYFFPGWLEPLLIDVPKILHPLTNRELTHRGLQNTLDFKDVVDHEELFSPILRDVRNAQGMQPVITFAYACVKIPWAVYSNVGPFDETFGRGGAEDGDYSIRAQILGYGVAYVKNSFVIHFNGKSTWCGAESEAESAERVSAFRSRFIEKWGEDLAHLFVAYDDSVLRKHPEALNALSRGDFVTAVRIINSARFK